jgi:ribosomal protein S18 acetylase RimI-like enzyme
VGIAIRPARREESADIVALWTAAGAHPTLTDNAESVEQLLVRDDAALLVAELDGHIVGTVIAGWNGWHGSVYRIAVLPEHRRRGIATALLREAESNLRARGAARIDAVVVASDDHAVAFWTAAGYEAPRDRVRFVKNVDR